MDEHGHNRSDRDVLDRTFLRATLDSLLDPLVVLRAERGDAGKIIDFFHVEANSAACEHCGLRRDELIDARIADLLPTEQASVIIAAYARIVESGTPLRFDDRRFAVETHDSDVRRYDVQATKVGDGVCVTWRDVTEQREHMAALESSGVRFQNLAEAASDIAFTTDNDGIITWVTPSVERLLGWRPESIVGTSARDLILGGEALYQQDDRTDFYAQGRPVEQREQRFRMADGGTRRMSLHATPMVDRAEIADGAFVGLRELDPEVQALDASERQFRLAMEGSPVGMAIIGLDLAMHSVNSALCEMLDRSEDWMLTHAIGDVIHPDDREADLAVRNDLQTCSTDHIAHERRLIDADGNVIWALHSIGLLRDNDGNPLFFVSQFQDITDRKMTEQNLRTAATRDPLTGLPNRVSTLEQITRTLADRRNSGRSVAVILLGLDRFRYVNNSLGHETGDELLRAAAQRVRSAVREGDLVSRHRGDEFVVVMHALGDLRGATDCAERLIAGFREPLHLGDIQLVTTASIGIAIMDEAEADAADLLRDAETAMYSAKEGGRDRLTVFNDELRAAVDDRLTIANDLRFALDRLQLVVWYQPEIDLRTHELCAVEALVRWNHPDGLMRAADWFIEIAEDSGIIFEIGEFVIHQACASGAAWASRRPLPVRINISAMQLSDTRLLGILEDAIGSSGIDPSLLCVEITETALLRDADTVRENLLAIHRRGIQIAIDDFGTGYASLTYLQDFPIDAIKIDKTFVAALTDGNDDHRLVAGVIALARSMEIPAIAEGIENREHERILRDLGCRSAQGWLYSKAVPSAEIDRLIDEERAGR